jgi:hypothetical protein
MALTNPAKDQCLLNAGRHHNQLHCSEKNVFFVGHKEAALYLKSFEAG